MKEALTKLVEDDMDNTFIECLNTQQYIKIIKKKHYITLKKLMEIEKKT